MPGPDHYWPTAGDAADHAEWRALFACCALVEGDSSPSIIQMTGTSKNTFVELLADNLTMENRLAE